MPPIKWPGVLGLEALSIGAAVAIAYVRGRKAVRQTTEYPGQRAAAVFAFAKDTEGLPLFALVAPCLTWWFVRRLPDSDGAGDWMFAVGWTTLVVAWLGVTRVQAGVLRDAGIPDVTPAAVLGMKLFVSWWLVVPPLLAGWAVVAFADAPPVPHGPDPTEALCFAAAVVASSIVVTWPLRRCIAAASEPPARVLAEFERLAGDGERPPVVAAPLRRFGLSDAMAHGDRRKPRISIDDRFAARVEPRESAAILLHELGHHRLGHLRRRAWAWKATLAVVLVAPTLLGLGHVAVFVVGLSLAYRHLLLPLWRRQELEADRFAADRCGAPVFAAALTSLHRERGLPDDFGGARGQMMHPDLKQRIAALGLDPADYLAPRAS